MTSITLRQPALYFTAAVTALTLMSVALPAQAFGPGAGFDFVAVDTDKDGKITQAELDAFQAARATEIDTDKDGFISAEEMAAHMSARMQDRIGKMARHAIVEQDEDGDGKVSLAEMGAHRGLDKLFAHADADGDAALSQEEIDTMHAKMQERHGRMGDGKHGGGEGRGHGGGMGGPFWLFGDDAAETE